MQGVSATAAEKRYAKARLDGCVAAEYQTPAAEYAHVPSLPIPTDFVSDRNILMVAYTPLLLPLIHIVNSYTGSAHAPFALALGVPLPHDGQLTDSSSGANTDHDPRWRVYGYVDGAMVESSPVSMPVEAMQRPASPYESGNLISVCRYGYRGLIWYIYGLTAASKPSMLGHLDIKTNTTTLMPPPPFVMAKDAPPWPCLMNVHDSLLVVAHATGTDTKDRRIWQIMTLDLNNMRQGWRTNIPPTCPIRNLWGSCVLGKNRMFLFSPEHPYYIDLDTGRHGLFNASYLRTKEDMYRHVVHVARLDSKRCSIAIFHHAMGALEMLEFDTSNSATGEYLKPSSVHDCREMSPGCIHHYPEESSSRVPVISISRGQMQAAINFGMLEMPKDGARYGSIEWKLNQHLRYGIHVS